MDEVIKALLTFMDKGGPVLWAIAALTLILWTLVLERIWYYKTTYKDDKAQALKAWEGRTERKSWGAHQVREKLLSQMNLKINQHLSFIQALVALAPLFGLLGTVWGMIEVFNIMAVTGGGDAKSMAGGVSKATIPTMAGMVAALSGVFSNTYVTSIASRESELLADSLTTDH
jgi:biopolymer transport protein ExbB